MIEKTVKEYLPFIATENLMMEAVKKGGDRQEIHEVIRRCSMEATARLKNGEPGGLTGLLAQEKVFGLSQEEIDALLEPSRYIGRCPEQVEAFLARYAPVWEKADETKVEIDL